jgi:hypothetical protein
VALEDDGAVAFVGELRQGLTPCGTFAVSIPAATATPATTCFHRHRRRPILNVTAHAYLTNDADLGMGVVVYAV